MSHLFKNKNKTIFKLFISFILIGIFLLTYLGTQNYSSKYQDRINKSMYSSNTLPFEQIKVGPGLGLNYEDKPEGGFHQDIRQYELPKTIDESLSLFENNEEIKTIFNDKFIRSIAAIRRVEYQAYLSVISSWEREYLLLNV